MDKIGFNHFFKMDKKKAKMDKKKPMVQGESNELWMADRRNGYAK